MLVYNHFFKPSNPNKKVQLYLRNTETNEVLDRPIEVDRAILDYNIQDLLGEEYKPVKSFEELIKAHNLSKKDNLYAKVASFSL